MTHSVTFGRERALSSPANSGADSPHHESERHEQAEQHEGRPHLGLAADDACYCGDEGHQREEAEYPREHLEVIASRHDFTPPAVRPEMIRRWKINTMITSGIATIVPAAMMAAYGTT